MRIEDHVTSPKTSQEFKDLGWDKKTVYVWLPLAPGQENSHTLVSTQAILDNSAFFEESKKYATPAPLATEIMEELPALLEGRYPLVVRKRDIDWKVAYELLYHPIYEAPNPAEALAQMWIYLKENDLLPAQPDDHEDN